MVNVWRADQREKRMALRLDDADDVDDAAGPLKVALSPAIRPRLPKRWNNG
jgi:hypothetical protein